jgi:hypothetical protein
MKKPIFVHVTMTLDLGTAEKVRALAVERDNSVSGLVRELIQAAWAKQHDRINKQLDEA